MLDINTMVCRWMFAIFITGVVCGQSGGRFEETKRLALAYIESNQYDRAAGKLEEIWEQSQSDPDIAEWLAIAYLNGQDRQYHPEVETKSLTLMQQALRLGGKATLLVQHSHEKMGWLQGHTVSNYCSGKLSILPGRLIFVATARKGLEEHSFDVQGSEVRVSGPSAKDHEGAFQVKTKARSYSMLPTSRKFRDSETFLSLVQQQLGGK